VTVDVVLDVLLPLVTVAEVRVVELVELADADVEDVPVVVPVNELDVRVLKLTVV
jgi:hypothetical protein